MSKIFALYMTKMVLARKCCPILGTDGKDFLPSKLSDHGLIFIMRLCSIMVICAGFILTVLFLLTQQKIFPGHRIVFNILPVLYLLHPLNFREV